jgi:hypothetical protein
VDPAWGSTPENTNLGVNVTGNQIDTTIPGTYTVTYTATDQAGNTATSTRSVIVTGTQNNAEQTLVPEPSSVQGEAQTNADGGTASTTTTTTDSTSSSQATTTSSN